MSTEKELKLINLESLIVKSTTVNPAHFPHVTVFIAECANGYIVIGKSVPANPHNFDADLGIQYAKKDALRQLFALEGYAIKDRRARAS